MDKKLIEIYDIAAAEKAVELIEMILILGAEVEGGLLNAEQGISDILNLIDEFMRKHHHFSVPKEDFKKIINLKETLL